MERLKIIKKITQVQQTKQNVKPILCNRILNYTINLGLRYFYNCVYNCTQCFDDRGGETIRFTFKGHK